MLGRFVTPSLRSASFFGFRSCVRSFSASPLARTEAVPELLLKSRDSTIQHTQHISKPDLTPLKLSNQLYASLRVHGVKYLVTEGDKMYLLYNLREAEVGDILHFNDVTTIGSRDYTFSDDPIDPSLYSVKAVVIEKTTQPRTERIIKQPRTREYRRAVSQPKMTILRVMEVKLRD